MVQSSKNFATHVKAGRIELGLSPAAAADQVGVTRQAWAGWEKGTVPHDRNWAAIERTLRWKRGSVEAILDGGNPTPIRPGEPAPSVDLMLFDLGMDPKVFARQSRTLRENLYQAWLNDRNRRLSADSDANADAKNPPIEGRDERRA